MTENKTTTASTEQAYTQAQQNAWSQYQQQYHQYYNQQYAAAFGQPYAQYYQQQYYQQMGYPMHLMQNYNNTTASDAGNKQNENNTNVNNLPPLPPGPPPPLNGSSQALLQKPSFANFTSQQDKQANSAFGSIKFNLNKRSAPGQLPQNNNPLNNSGAAKKKRKRFKNQLNNSFNNRNGQLNMMPPLPPPEQQQPKPAPPPETMPPLPPNSPPTTPQPPSTPATPQKRDSPLLPTPTIPPQVKPKPNAFNNPTGEWPKELQDYVNRCYAKCKTAIDKDQVEIVLKGKITAAAGSGELWVKDWANEPLPSIHSERMTLVPKTVPGQLSLYQNSSTPLGTPKGLMNRGKKTGLSAAMGARLGARASTLRSDRSRSRSRSRSSSKSKSRSPVGRYRKKSRSGSHSPRRHRTSSSSSSETEDYKSFTPKKGKGRGKVQDRLSLGPNKTKLNMKSKKQLKKEKKQSSFYSEFGLQCTEPDNERLQQRAARFSNSTVKSVASTVETPLTKKKKVTSVCSSLNSKDLFYEDCTGDFDWTDYHIIGTCQTVTKSFLRLTKAPDPSEVRPVSVLKLALQMVKDDWKVKADYFNACDQLKSIRQDLTVQGVRDDFTVEVYETHARIALENSDHEEFNQCQTQLKLLYTEVKGEHEMEFIAYRILYYIFTKNTLDIMTILKSLKPENRKNEYVAFALNVRSAWSLGDFHKFFKLYRNSPAMTGYLVDWFVNRERKLFLKSTIKAYRQTIPLTYVSQTMAFETIEKCLEFLTPFGITFTDASRTIIDCKTSMSSLPNI